MTTATPAKRFWVDKRLAFLTGCLFACAILVFFVSLPSVAETVLCRSGELSANLETVEIEGVDYLSLNELADRTGLGLRWEALIGRLTLLRDRQERVVALVDSPLYRVRNQYVYQRFGPRWHEGGLYLPFETVRDVLAEALDLEFSISPTPSPTVPVPTVTPTPRSATLEMPVVQPIPTFSIFYDFPEVEEEEPSVITDFPEPEPTEGPHQTVVVLDPGPMPAVAVNEASITEPGGDLTYDLAVLLKRKLEEGLSVKVVLTREKRGEQPNMTAEERAIRANTARGDLLLSLRAGRSFSEQAEGFSIFYMSEIADEQEPLRFDSQGQPVGDWVFEKEHGWRTAYLPHVMESARLARLVRKHLDRQAMSPDRGMRSGRLLLLRSVQMPAVWLEVGVLSNRKDAYRLQNADYQEDVVTALFLAIQEYLDTLPGSGQTLRENY